jgi:hypothetical protein
MLEAFHLRNYLYLFDNIHHIDIRSRNHQIFEVYRLSGCIIVFQKSLRLVMEIPAHL